MGQMLAMHVLRMSRGQSFDTCTPCGAEGEDGEGTYETQLLNHSHSHDATGTGRQSLRCSMMEA